MNPSSNTGYSWTNTSQWSQLPTSNQQTNASKTSNSGQTSTPKNTGLYNTTGMQQAYQTPETRRDMVTRLYKMILGREPDNAGLNYYLFNSNISEAQIAKEMYESTEHQGIISRSKDVREMIAKLDSYNKEVNELKTKLLNAENLSNSYKALLDQKSQLINQLQSQTNSQGLINSGNNVQAQQQDDQNHQPSQDKQSDSQKSNQQQIQQNDLNQNISDALLLNDPFASDSSNKKKGCIGWITNWFKFS